MDADLATVDADGRQLMQQLRLAEADEARGRACVEELEARLGRHREEQLALADGGEDAAREELGRMARRIAAAAAAAAAAAGSTGGVKPADDGAAAAWRLRPFAAASAAAAAAPGPASSACADVEAVRDA